jgi:hypothetical protein
MLSPGVPVEKLASPSKQILRILTAVAAVTVGWGVFDGYAVSVENS